MSDHKRIWLQNAKDEDSSVGRLWCQDKVWPNDPEDGEPTEYVRADLYERLRAALRPFANMAKLFDEDPNDLPDTASLASYSVRDKTNRATVGDLRRARAALSGKGET